MKKNILIILFLSLSFTLFAQNRKILTPDGKLHSINEVEKIKQFNKVNPQTKNYNLPSGTIDTLDYGGLGIPTLLLRAAPYLHCR